MSAILRWVLLSYLFADRIIRLAFRAVLSAVPGNNWKVQPEYSGFFYLRRDSEIDSVS